MVALSSCDATVTGSLPGFLAKLDRLRTVSIEFLYGALFVGRSAQGRKFPNQVFGSKRLFSRLTHSRTSP